MTATTVTWRQTVAAVAVVAMALVGVVAVFSSDGLPAVNAASSRATRWFVHQPTGTVVLLDGYGGRAVARIDAESAGEQISVAEGGSAAYLLNDTTAEVKMIETAELRFGAPVSLAALGGGRAVSQVGSAGLTVVNPDDGGASALPVVGEPLNFDVDLGAELVVAPDGVVWTIDGSALRRATSTSSSDTELGLGPDAVLTLVGSEPFVVDRANRRARLGTGSWQAIDTDADPSEIIGQVNGPSAKCGWVAANDDLWCVGRGGIEERSTIPGLDVDGPDALAIAGDAAVVVRRTPSTIVQLDWRGDRIVEDVTMTTSPDADLAVIATTDLVWVDDVAGDFVWAVNPWKVSAIDKNGDDVFVVGEDGTVIDQGDLDDSATPTADDPSAGEIIEREPDDNGVDDPPVAVDDPVTARSGASVQVQVTANDYDPDGEAIVVQSVGPPGHGKVEIGTASTVVYTPEAGYVGADRFTYTIVDGNGTEASATVLVELLPAGSANTPPIGTPDTAQTGPGTPVVVEVLLNDVDPERDALRIGSFTPPDGPSGAPIGEVTETVGKSGLPALRFVPAAGFEGTAIFSYRPVDSLDGQGNDVQVRVEVAASNEANRPPVARPDSIRARRNMVTQLPVLVNDIDPDGDELTLDVVTPLPAGLDVTVRGAELTVVVRTGAADLLPFQYEIADGHGGVARGSVLVDVIDDAEPNLPPVVTADSDTVVVGSSIDVNVLANDVDPDGDRLVVVSASQPPDGLGQAFVLGDAVRFTPASIGERDDTTARFTYTVSDGNGHEVTGDVSVSILSESAGRPPYARDDSAFTYVDTAVTIDVLRNDGDPAGDRPRLVGTPGCAGGGAAVVTADGQVRFDPPRGQVGAFRCTYEVTNSSGLRAGASIIISVRAPLLTNEPPVAVNDLLPVEVNTTQAIDVTRNDSDPDGPNSSLTVVSSTAPLLGTATRSGNVIAFTAGAVTGVTTIRYQVADAGGAVSLGQLTVTINEKANVAPIAQDDGRLVFAPGAPAAFDVLENDNDPDGQNSALRVQSASKVSGDGSVSQSGNIVTLTPSATFLGDLVATYTIVDPDGLTSSARVTLQVVKQPNRPPEARDDSNDVANGGSVSTAVLFNDFDPDGDNLSISITAAPDPSLGSARVTSDRSIAFTAVPGAAGTAVIRYQISDGELSADATLRITVRACTESQPVAGSATLTTGYQQAIGVDLNALAANGTIVDVSGPAGYGDGLYTPPAGENGNVQISYAVVNSCRQRASGTVTIDVNQDPIAQPQSFTIGRGESREIPVSSIASDAEPLTIVSSSGAPGWVVTEAGRLLLRPAAGAAVGTATWTTVVADPGGLTTSVSFSVKVTNQLPTGAPDTVDVRGGVAVLLSPLDNDNDPDGPNAALAIQSVPATITFPNGKSGTVTIVGTRQLSVDPAGGLGNTSFTYTMRDADGGVSAPITVTVVANRAPFANSQTVTAVATQAIDVALDAGDPDGDALTIVELTDPSGVVTTQAGLSLRIIPPAAGTFSVTYRVSDGRATSAIATITINASDPPPPTTVPPTTVPPTTVPPTTPTTTAPADPPAPGS